MRSLRVGIARSVGAAARSVGARTVEAHYQSVDRRPLLSGASLLGVRCGSAPESADALTWRADEARMSDTRRVERTPLATALFDSVPCRVRLRLASLPGLPLGWASVWRTSWARSEHRLRAAAAWQRTRWAPMDWPTRRRLAAEERQEVDARGLARSHATGWFRSSFRSKASPARLHGRVPGLRPNGGVSAFSKSHHHRKRTGTMVPDPYSIQQQDLPQCAMPHARGCATTLELGQLPPRRRAGSTPSQPSVTSRPSP